jgi:uncharacterized protein YdiU (UPF0061 family)
VKGFNFSKVTPTPLDEPFLAASSEEVLKMIGVGDDKIYDEDYLAQVLSGSLVEEGCIPLS